DQPAMMFDRHRYGIAVKWNSLAFADAFTSAPAAGDELLFPVFAPWYSLTTENSPLYHWPGREPVPTYKCWQRFSRNQKREYRKTEAIDLAPVREQRWSGGWLKKAGRRQVKPMEGGYA